MTLNLTKEQAQALVGLLDIAIKQVGIRAMEDDVVGLMHAIRAAGQPSEERVEG
jgi:hypothetical protein